MILAIAPRATRAEYLRFDLEQLGQHDEILLVVKSSHALDELALSTDQRAIIPPPDKWRTSWVDRNAQRLRRRLRSDRPSGAADRLLASLEWRLRWIDRVVRNRQHRVRSRTPYATLLERALHAIRESAAPDEIWVYDVSYLPEVMRVFDGASRVVVR